MESNANAKTKGNVDNKTKETSKDTKAVNAKQNSLSNDNNIFIRNLSFTTTEEKLKELFSNYLPKDEIVFCLLVKDKETKLSKGTAFIKVKLKTSYDKLMSMYHEYNNKTSKQSTSGMNPFELEGRNLKLFPAMSKNELEKSHGENEDSLSNRKKEYLYYGLSNETISTADYFEEITETDKTKRERLIEIKKANFQKNPNYHVSLTRLSLRNFEKSVKEEDIKEMISNTVQKDKQLRKDYKNVKMVKQIKLLREDQGDTEKSKCVAFVECCSFDFAKKLIDKLSGFKMTNKTKKGLIIDFSLDDFRKRTARLNKLNRIKEIRKEKRKEESKSQSKGEKIEIAQTNNIDKLIDYYHMTLSRGKKQRIKKKLKALGFNKPIPPMGNKANTKEDDEYVQPKEEYVKLKISNNRTEINKKMKEKRKENKYKKEDKLLNIKRGRSADHTKEQKEILLRRKGHRVQKKGLDKVNISSIKKRKINTNANDDNDNEDDDEEMKGYYSKIMANLNKNK